MPLDAGVRTDTIHLMQAAAEKPTHQGDGIEVTGTWQHYPWGDTTALPTLLGTKSDGRPCAEWWIGTHPRGEARTLDGAPVREKCGELPLMVKLIACATPLSLQIHPNAAQARRGWERTLRDGSGEWTDPNEKNETLHALTPFELIAGFQNQCDAEAALETLGWRAALAQLREEGIARYLEWAWVDAPVVPEIKPGHWLEKFATHWPGDRALYVAAIMQHHQLERGQQLHIPAGVPHAYIHGVGIEAMTNSDNVLRGGFTEKKINTAAFTRTWRERQAVRERAIILDWTKIRTSSTIYTRENEHAILLNIPHTHLAAGHALILPPESSHTFYNWDNWDNWDNGDNGDNGENGGEGAIVYVCRYWRNG